jgi:MiaB/RimO family radical SAM methylthiotransferase
VRTFCIQTLGCKVNQYESEQIATLLRRRGMVETHSPQQADLRIVNTCSVTMQAASKSRQQVRRITSLPVLHSYSAKAGNAHPAKADPWRTVGQASKVANSMVQTALHGGASDQNRGRTIVTGCWATSDRDQAASLAGVDAVLTHHDDVAAELDRLIELWNNNSDTYTRQEGENQPIVQSSAQGPVRDDLSDDQAGDPALRFLPNNKPRNAVSVKKNPAKIVGTHSLPLIEQRDSHHQRAFLKIQDGCDAHCTYCIIPQLRPGLWSKPVEDVLEEARRLVDAGHQEIVLTGIFLGAYGQETAIRRRQAAGERVASDAAKWQSPLARLVDALCTQVRGMKRLRFSSLEPGDLTRSLISNLKSHPQVVPHFHLPLQSGSDLILKRMNRQYTRDDYLRMIDHVHTAFDRPAITTDIIVGFPGETDEQFQQTIDVVERAKFIHIHAFSFSPRPGTAAARWNDEFIRGPVVNQRIEHVAARGLAHGLEFRKQFLGETVELLVEHANPFETLRHGRTSRYFDVWFDAPQVRTGDAVRVTIDRVTANRTFGCMLDA